MTKKYRATSVTVEDILSWIKQGQIGLPEMQRPFVWSTSKVRDLIDSLYNDYPIGYIVTWENPIAKLKNNSSSLNKQIIIDGQQRLTALEAALVGEKVVTRRYTRKRIQIAFKPSTGEFATNNAAHERDPLWINDVSEIFQADFNEWSFVSRNAQKLGMSEETLGKVIVKLLAIKQSDIGDIQLSQQLNLSAVIDIFNRINSTGVSLSSADLVMSRLSADSSHGGNILRKQIEYFVQLLNDPTLLENIKTLDPKFTMSKKFEQIKWVREENTPIYVPNYADILHVMLATAFYRGKLSDMVSLISGRDFSTRSFSEESMKDNYEQLLTASKRVLNKSNYQRYTMILRDMGMRNSGKLGLFGNGTLNFGYILFLYLKAQKNVSKLQSNSLLKRWIVMSTLTGRYSGSSETAFERDLRLISQSENLINQIEIMLSQNLSESFWTTTLPDNLRRSTTQSSGWRIFQMAQIHDHDVAWLDKDTLAETVMIEEGNIHHIFPRAYLKKHNFPKGQINQIANYVWLTQPLNLAIGATAPQKYLSDKNINKFLTLENSAENAIPYDLNEKDYQDYPEFLHQRRVLMAHKIRNYYDSL